MLTISETIKVYLFYGAGFKYLKGMESNYPVIFTS